MPCGKVSRDSFMENNESDGAVEKVDLHVHGSPCSLSHAAVRQKHKPTNPSACLGRKKLHPKSVYA